MACGLTGLPDDILFYILTLLPARSLARLSRTSHALHALITFHGWALYVRHHLALDPVTVSPLRDPRTSWARKAQFSVRVDRAWHTKDFKSIQLGPPWRHRCLPVVKLDRQAGRVLVAVGTQLRIHEFDAWGVPLGHASRPPPTINLGRSQVDDITGIALVDRSPDELVLSHVSGLLERVRLDQSSPRGFVPIARYSFSSRPIHAIHSSAGLLASVSYSGTVALHRIGSPWQTPATIDLPSRAWAVLLSPGAHWLAVGHVGDQPISVYPLAQAARGIPGLPGDGRGARKLGGNRARTAVYALTTPLPSSPLFGSSSTLIAGCFDSCVRVYDLRLPPGSLSSSSSSTSSLSDEPSPSFGHSGGGAVRVQQPVLTFDDRWSEEAVYSVACGGGAGTSIAAGVARHGVVRIWDARAANRDEGVSIFSQGRDSSPVYSLDMVTVFRSRPNFWAYLGH
jgi:WD40 repeat protein